MNEKEINVIGAGLAGCECALQAAKRGIKVNLFEMRPEKTTGAHKTDKLAEFVCSNSLGGAESAIASGLLKKEMEILGGELIQIAYECRVPAGGALAIDREAFSNTVTERIENNPNINLIKKEVEVLPTDFPTVVASGPLTSETFANSIKNFTNSEHLHFFDAIAPIVEKDSIDFDIAFYANRYDNEDSLTKKSEQKEGSAAYINCPMNVEQYKKFYDILISSPRIEQKDFEQKSKFFESCLPIEVIASRGVDTLRFGPLKPIGLVDKRTEQINYAVVQLRQDNAAQTLYNLVGFQTNLKWGAQKELIHSIPGLENANIVRYGVMHRNTFINSPTILKPTLQTVAREDLFFAGQLTGTEGYTESIADGLIAGINVSRLVNGQATLAMPKETMIGALLNYISNSEQKHFQPINSNWGILPNIEMPRAERKNKKLKHKMQAEISINALNEFIKNSF